MRAARIAATGRDHPPLADLLAHVGRRQAGLDPQGRRVRHLGRLRGRSVIGHGAEAAGGEGRGGQADGNEGDGVAHCQEIVRRGH